MIPDDEPLAEDCGHRVSTLGAAFHCVLTEPHDEHVWRHTGTASRGLGYFDNVDVAMEIRWRDVRPAATVGDLRRALGRWS